MYQGKTDLGFLMLSKQKGRIWGGMKASSVRDINFGVSHV